MGKYCGKAKRLDTTNQRRQFMPLMVGSMW